MNITSILSIISGLFGKNMKITPQAQELLNSAQILLADGKITKEEVIERIGAIARSKNISPAVVEMVKKLL